MSEEDFKNESAGFDDPEAEEDEEFEDSEDSEDDTAEEEDPL